MFISGGTFTLNGGTISGNSANGGGGIAMDGGTFNFSSGSIHGNTARNGGGGVSMWGSATFNMSGGTISGNSAPTDRGGGVVMNNGTFTMSGGTIYGNETADVANRNTAGISGHAFFNGGGTARYGNNTTIPSPSNNTITGM